MWLECRDIAIEQTYVPVLTQCLIQLEEIENKQIRFPVEAVIHTKKKKKVGKRAKSDGAILDGFVYIYNNDSRFTGKKQDSRGLGYYFRWDHEEGLSDMAPLRKDVNGVRE